MKPELRHLYALLATVTVTTAATVCLDVPFVIKVIALLSYSYVVWNVCSVCHLEASIRKRTRELLNRLQFRSDDYLRAFAERCSGIAWDAGTVTVSGLRGPVSGRRYPETCSGCGMPAQIYPHVFMSDGSYLCITCVAKRLEADPVRVGDRVRFCVDGVFDMADSRKGRVTEVSMGCEGIPIFRILPDCAWWMRPFRGAEFAGAVEKIGG